MPTENFLLYERVTYIQEVMVVIGSIGPMAGVQRSSKRTTVPQEDWAMAEVGTDKM
jgi:hypothetical protein